MGVACARWRGCSAADRAIGGVERRVDGDLERRVASRVCIACGQIVDRSGVRELPREWVPRHWKPMNEKALEWPLTRRQVLAAGFAASAGFVVGCGSAAKDAAGWAFIDDRKQTVRLPERPTRVVAYST